MPSKEEGRMIGSSFVLGVAGILAIAAVATMQRANKRMKAAVEEAEQSAHHLGRSAYRMDELLRNGGAILFSRAQVKVPTPSETSVNPPKPEPTHE